MKGIDALLALVEGGKAPTMHATAWDEAVGADLVQMLRRLGVLVEQSPTDWYPCGGAWGDGCPRRVVENRGCPTHPQVAVCGQDSPACIEVLLRGDELKRLALSLDAFVLQLRRALRLGGSLERGEESVPNTIRLGGTQGADRPVFLALAPRWPGFEEWLALRGDALVLVPRSSGLPSRVRDHHLRRGPIEVVPLGEVLQIVPAGFQVATRTTDRSATQPTRADERTICCVIDHDGQRALTTAQYHALVERASDLAFFIDAITTVDGRGHRALSKDANGRLREDNVTKDETAALIALVRSRRALRAGEFDSLPSNDVASVAKTVERARRKIDVSPRRYVWRSFHTLSGDTPEAKRFQFNPPKDMKFAIVVPATDVA